MRRIAALLLGLMPMAAPAQSANLVCHPELVCSNATCYPVDGTNPEVSNYIEDPMGAVPVMLGNEGRRYNATRTEGVGVIIWTALSDLVGGSIVFSVRHQGGAYIYVQHEYDSGDRVWIASGRCE